MMSSVFRILLIVSGCYICTEAVFNAEGYVTHARRNCPRNDFIHGHQVKSFEECRHICDVHTQCVGFVFRPYYNSAFNCWPKSVCVHLNYASGGWATYKRMPGRGGCTFDNTTGFALYGNNDEILETSSVNSCQRKCLWDMKCKSFDFNSQKKLCFLSYNSRETESSFFLPHPQMTYFHKRCGTDIEPFPLRLLAGRTEASYWMKDGQCVKTFGPYGTRRTATFTDEDMMFNNITEITVWYGRYIDRVAIKYGTVLRTHGGSGGRRVTIPLNPGEYISGIEGRYGSLVDKLLFITNQRTIGPYGGDGGLQFSLDGNGKPLSFISGLTSSFVANLYFHFMC